MNDGRSPGKTTALSRRFVGRILQPFDTTISKVKMKTASIFFLLALCQIAVAQIIVTPDVFEFGVVKEHQRPIGTATLTNTGKTTVTVTKLMRTCVCSDAKIDKQEIKPGESANAQSASGRLVPPPCGSGQGFAGRHLPDPCVSAPALTAITN
jgi:hypothetical protein